MGNRKTLLILALALPIGAWQGGCTRSTPVPPSPAPPAATATVATADFDQKAYETLMIAQAVLDASKLQATKFPKIKDPLNKAGAAYNVARTAYIAYHSAASHDQMQTAKLLEQLNDLTHAVSTLSVSLGAKL